VLRRGLVEGADSLAGRIGAAVAGQDASGREALLAIAAGRNLSKHVGHFKSQAALSIIDESDQRGFTVMLQPLACLARSQVKPGNER
jgi:hypothetical protein